MEKSLRLYYKPNCGYCHKVIEKLKTEIPEVSVELIDVVNDPVILHGISVMYGNDAVPVLLDFGHMSGNNIPVVQGNQEGLIDNIIRSYRPLVK